MNVFGGGAWKLTVCADAPALYTDRPPCWFHRAMQRLILGFRWSRESLE